MHEIYDLHKSKSGVVDTPVLESRYTSCVLFDNNSQTEFKHLDPIWQLQWVDQGDERGESLVSVSSDGRVIQWSIKKGLEHKGTIRFVQILTEKELMKLKRVSNQGKMVQKKNEAFIARQAGLCLDFNKKDTNMYDMSLQQLIHLF